MTRLNLVDVDRHGGLWEKRLTRNAILRGDTDEQIAQAWHWGWEADGAEYHASLPCKTRILSKRRMRLENAWRKFIWRLSLPACHVKRWRERRAARRGDK